MKRFPLFCLVLFFLLSLTGMGGKPDPASLVTIKSVNIRDQSVINNNKPIMVTFSAPMVAEDKVKQEIPAAQMPVIITPALPIKGTWVSQESFVFQADGGYPRGKQFYMQIRDGLKSLDGKEVGVVFSFRTASTTVRYMEVDKYDFAANTLRLAVQLSQPVSREALAKHLTVTDVATGKVYAAEVLDSSESTTHTIEVPLGERVEKVEVTISEDSGDKDPYSVGLEAPYIAQLTMPRPQQPPTAVEMTRTATGRKSDLNLREPYSTQYDTTIQARFSFTRPIADQPLENLIVIDPPLSYELSGYRDGLTISEGLKPGQQVTVTLKPGLMDDQGNTLEEELSRTLTVADFYPRVTFPEIGNFLISAYNSKFPVELVNVDKVVITLSRLYDNNLPFTRFEDDYNDRKDYLARNILSKSIDVTAGKNEILRRAVDISDLAGGQKGVFRLRLEYYAKQTYDNETYMSYEGSQERWVVVSDIGVTSRVFDSGVTVFVNSLSTAKPLANAEVRVYSRSNQLLAQGRTDADGLMSYTGKDVWDNQLRPDTVVVQAGKDVTVLPMDYTTSANYQDPGGSRPYLNTGYEAFLYTPRGVFRPGETVDIKAFVRDARHLPPAPFPVLFTISNPRGLEAGRGSAMLSNEGGANFQLVLPSSAPTGVYYARIFTPGSDDALGVVSFNVEDFVPPRLEVNLKTQDLPLVGSSTTPVALNAMYLFGAPGANLDYEFGYRARPKGFSHPDWEGYNFGNNEQRFDAESNLKYITGALDENGNADITMAAPANWHEYNTFPLSVQLIASVMEDGGRWVTATSNLDYYPTDYFLGMRFPQGDSFDPAKPVTVQLAAVDLEGKARDKDEPVNLEIFRVQGIWNTVIRNGRYTYTWNERLIKVKSEEVPLTKGRAEYTFTPGEYGMYLVRMSDSVTAASRRISVWGSWDSEEGAAARGGSGRLDQLELSLDKSEYFVGDVAKLSIKAPFAGTLFLGIERATQVSTRVMVMDQPSMVVDIPVTGYMDPNVTITAWVYRPMKAENKEWFAHRALGVTSLSLSKAPFKMNVEAQTPERASPSAPLAVPFKVTDSDGKPVQGEFSIALVDEGILSLTAFPTPDPLGFFYAKRYSLASSYDIYDRLIRPELRAATLLEPGGDAALGAEDYRGSLSTEQIFLAAFLPTVKTDASGNAVANFDIPEYSGKGRLMIVGASGNRFASSAAPVRFARDVVVEPSAPRAVAPGDSFDITLKAFTLDSALTGEAEIGVSAAGPLKLSGDVKNKLALGKAAGKNLIVRANALNESGIAEIAVNVTVPGREDLNFVKTVQVAVRPPFARTSDVVSELITAGRKKTLAVQQVWLPGSASASFSVDHSPVMAILPALNFLREYPYGCLEQTTSRAWPWLTLPSILKALDPAYKDEASVTKTLSDTVARLVSMQTAEGGFTMWPGGASPDVWLSTNAAHFLVEAKDRVPVPPGALNNSIKYMRYLLIAPAGYFGDDTFAYTTKAYAAYVLTRAGDAPLSWLQTLSEHEKVMLPSGRIFLAAAKALHAGNAKPLEILLKADLTIPKEYRYGYSLETDLRNRSLMLMAWSMVAPADPNTAQLAQKVAETLGQRRWFTTQEAGIAALALGLYIEKNPVVGGKDTAAEIRSAGKVLAEFRKDRVILPDSAIPRTDKGQPAPIEVAVDKGVAYAVYSVRGVPMSPPRAQSNGMSLSRVWKDSSGTVIFDDKTDKPVVVKQGERVTVEITIRPDFSINDLVLSDLTPGGMEVENPRLNTSADEESQAVQGYLDLLEDRLLLFLTRVWENGYTYRYTMRAVSRGAFALPQVAAEGMYNPEVNAISAPAVLVVE